MLINTFIISFNINLNYKLDLDYIILKLELESNSKTSLINIIKEPFKLLSLILIFDY